MQVIDYLKEHGVEKLKSEFSIIIKEYDEGLLVLNYDQINSPKHHDIVKECRGLILDKNFEVVSRSFDRFMNYGENGAGENVNWMDASIRDKVDGSLIKIYWFDGEWRISTRGTAFAESNCNGFGTFRELVLRATGDDDAGFQASCNFYLDREWTYICEFTSVENRVVTRYEGYELHFLAARHNATGVYGDQYEKHSAIMALGAVEASEHSFDSIEHCIETAKQLPDLKEGYVVYVHGEPVFKIKSPAYVAVHLIRGEGLNPKRIMQLVLMNEVDEYLSYFPEDWKFFTPYERSYVVLREEMDTHYKFIADIESQKDFAKKVVGEIYASCLFSARKNGTMPSTEYAKMSEPAQMAMLVKMMEEMK